MELLNNTLSNLKEKYNEISGGCGEELLNTTFQAANIPSVQATYEVRAKMPLLSLSYLYPVLQ